MPSKLVFRVSLMQPDVLKAELDSRMIGAEARHAATIDAIKREAGEEVVSDL
jgi:hypothetical protein